MKENIIRLKIPMHNIILVQDLKSLQQLFKNKQRTLLIQHILLPQHALECSPITVLIDEVKIILSFKHIVVGYDMVVFFNVCQDVDLMHRAFLELFVCLEFFYFDYLHCVFFVVHFVYGPVYFTVGPFSDHLV